MRKRGVFAVETAVTVPFFDVDSMNVVWAWPLREVPGTGALRTAERDRLRV